MVATAKAVMTCVLFTMCSTIHLPINKNGRSNNLLLRKIAKEAPKKDNRELEWLQGPAQPEPWSMIERAVSPQEPAAPEPSQAAELPTYQYPPKTHYDVWGVISLFVFALWIPLYIAGLGAHALWTTMRARGSTGAAQKLIAGRPSSELSGAQNLAPLTAALHAAQNVADLVDNVAAKIPEALAVRDLDASIGLSYKDLVTRASDVSEILVASGLRSGDIVALLFAPSARLAVCALGVSKAGAAWFPVDRRQPTDRIRQLLTETVHARLALVADNLAQVGVAAKPHDWATELGVPFRFVGPQGELERTLLEASDSSSSFPGTACVFSTSGSTGKPKAVAYSHKQVLHGTLTFADMCGIDSDSVCLLKSVPSWAVIEYELFPALVSGATLVCREKCQFDALVLAETLASEKVSVLLTSGPVLRVLVDGPWQDNAPELLGHIVNVGGSLALDVCQDVQDRHGSVSIHNIYGASESSCTTWTFSPGRAASDVSDAPTGHPQPGVEIHILDPQLRPVPAGVSGQVFFGGDFLANGYLGQPDLTSEKFVPNPFGSGRLYATGDVGCLVEDRLAPDGLALQVSGRVDRELNINGNRFAPEEVEAVILRVKGVQSAAVVAGKSAAGSESVVAFIAGSAGAGAPRLEAAVGEACAAQLPTHARPAMVRCVAELPALSNGKIDLSALGARASMELDSAKVVATMSSLNVMQLRSSKEAFRLEIFAVARALAMLCIVMYHYVGHIELMKLVSGSTVLEGFVRGTFNSSHWPMTVILMCSGITDSMTSEWGKPEPFKQELFVFFTLVALTIGPVPQLLCFVHRAVLFNDLSHHRATSLAEYWYLPFYLFCRLVHRLAFKPMKGLLAKLPDQEAATVRMIFLFAAFIGLNWAGPSGLANVNLCAWFAPNSPPTRLLAKVLPSSAIWNSQCALDRAEGQMLPLLVTYTIAWWCGNPAINRIGTFADKLSAAVRWRAGLLGGLCGLVAFVHILCLLPAGIISRMYPEWPEDVGWVFKDECLATLLLLCLAMLADSGRIAWFRRLGLKSMGMASFAAYCIHLQFFTLFGNNQRVALCFANVVIVPDLAMMSSFASCYYGCKVPWAGPYLVMSLLLGYVVAFMVTVVTLWHWLSFAAFDVLYDSSLKAYNIAQASLLFSPTKTASLPPPVQSPAKKAVANCTAAPVPPVPVLSSEGQSWMRWRSLRDKRCSRNLLVCIDGGTGTEVERLTESDESVHPEGWSCLQWKTHPDVLRKVHLEYMRSGAEVVISNTYATNRHVMTGAGYEDLTEQANTVAVQLALEAREAFLKEERRPDLEPLVAGSISCHPPGMAHGEHMDKGKWPAPSVESAGYEEQARILGQAGVDAIFVEMVWDWSEHGKMAVRGACSAGLPVVVNLSVYDVEGSGVGRPGLSDGTLVRDVARELAAGDFPNVEAILIHHTKLPLVLPCLKALREGGWKGPVGAYPDHGTFKMPNWCFDHLEAECILRYVRQWKEETGATIFGGCCGVGPDTIREMSKHCRSFNCKNQSCKR